MSRRYFFIRTNAQAAAGVGALPPPTEILYALTAQRKFAEKPKILEIAKYVDLFLFDCKETDPDLHKEYTGVDNKIILENLKALSDAGSKIILRCPIIPGFNDRAEHFKGISETAEKFIGIEHIEIEPFHPLGESKYSALGREVADIPVPSGKTVDKWIKQIGCGTDKDVICAYQA